MALNDTAQLRTSGSYDHVGEPVTIMVAHNTSFNILEHVGSGTYGHVFLAQCRECGFQGALKIVPAVASEDPELPHTTDRHVRREVSFHSYLNVTNPNLPHVVRALNGWKMEGFTKQQYLDWYEQHIKSLLPNPDTATCRLKVCLPDNMLLNIYFILMPYYKKGNLKTWLSQNPKFSDEAYEQRLSLFRDILSAVEFMHKKDLIHRRLCPDNILLNDDGHSRIRAVIGGLGRITSYGKNPAWPLSENNGNVSRRIEILGAGPEAFRELFEAPEVKGTDYDQSCDYYSIGVIALQLFWNLHTRNDIVDAILRLQNDGMIGQKQDNQALPEKEFWLDVVRKQVSRKREQRYSCSNLFQMCVGLKDHEMQDVQYESPTYQTLEPIRESPVMFNIASTENRRSVSSVSTSSSTASLAAQLAPERALSIDDHRKLSPSLSVPSPSSSRTSRSSLSVDHRNLSFNDLLAILNTPSVRWALLDHLNVEHVSIYLNNLGPTLRTQLTQSHSTMSSLEKVDKLLEYVKRNEKAIVEFFDLLARHQPDLYNTVMMAYPICDRPGL